MTPVRQRTLAKETSLDGIGLHTGRPVTLTFHPAPVDGGIRFRRVDLGDDADVPATLDHVADTLLGTTLAAGETRIMTVEHVLAALYAARVDNVVVEVTGPETPIRDGSFRDNLEALLDAGIVEQDGEARILSVRQPLSVTGEGGESYVAVPGDGLRISATIDFPHPAIGRAYGSFGAEGEAFRRELAPARTFGFKADADELHHQGLARGASLDNTIVLAENGGVLNDGLRFSDEFLRHKVGDIVGDLALLGARIDAHIVAERPSHAGNVELARQIMVQHRRHARAPRVDITELMKYLPHRYPMLLVDRIVDLEEGRRIVGIKNVTINEPFFQGHYPGHPIMPGVLIIEAMAQVGGLLLIDAVKDPENKVVYFMSLDRVKWRRPVTPGDTLVCELEMIQFRRNVCRMRGKAFVEDTLVAEAELMATVVDR